MTAEQLTADVRKWHELMLALDNAMSAFSDLTQSSPEARLPRAIWETAGFCTEQLERRYNIQGELDYWWLECDLGRNAAHAEVEWEGKTWPLTTWDEFLAYLLHVSVTP